MDHNALVGKCPLLAGSITASSLGAFYQEKSPSTGHQMLFFQVSDGTLGAQKANIHTNQTNMREKDKLAS